MKGCLRNLMASYRDVEVFVDGVRYVPADNYALELSCTKSAGWRLYSRWMGKERLIGGEYDGNEMCIVVAGEVVLGKRPIPFVECGEIGGWNGQVNI